MILNENFDYHDLEGILYPRVTVDEYEAHLGENADIVTLTFLIKSELAGKDLVSWFEKGYDYILDSKLSDGEVSPGKYLVFVELSRRRSVPERIIELIDDLETLTNIPTEDWVIIVDDKEYPPEEEVLKKAIITSPHEYRLDKENEGELNEMRSLANLKNVDVHNSTEDDIKNYRMIAGL